MGIDRPLTRRDSVELWIGTYPSDDVPQPSDGGPAEAVWHAWFDRVTGRFHDLQLLCRVASPSFLAVGRPGVLYAVSEKTEGELIVLKMDGTPARPHDEPDGEHPGRHGSECGDQHRCEDCEQQVPEDGDQQRPGHGGQPHPEGGGQHRSDYSAQTPRDDSTESLPPVGMTTQIVRTGGAEPCHVCVHPALGAVVANYGSGSVAVIRLDANGLPLPGGPHQVLSFRGSGPVSGRQASAHAHFVFLAAGDSDTLLVSDLGSDKVRRCRIERVGQRLIEDGVAVELPAGTGPRHAVFSKDGRWLYVVGELDGRIHQVAWDGATASGVPVGSTPVAGRGGLSVDGCDTSSAEGFDGPQVAVCGDSPVEGFAGSAVTGGAGPSAVGCDRPPVGVQPSHLSRVGSTLIAGVRLADGLSMHRLAPDGSVGPGVFRALPGSNPRHHLDLPPWHLVALQGHGGVAVVDSDGRVSDVAPVPAPACIVTGVEIG